MVNSLQPWTVALDGGTTNTRARLLDAHTIVATARRAVGVGDAARGEIGRLAEAVRDCIAEVCKYEAGVRPGRIVAAGMLSSEVGLAAVPHVEAPAGLDDLARAVRVHALPDIADLPIHFIPGVKTTPLPGLDGWAGADVMRGEECETLGACLCLGPPCPPLQLPSPARVFVWPGSHTKVVSVDDSGRILGSFTTLAGELSVSLARHTLLAASLPAEWPAELDPEALAAGQRLVEREGLGRTAFLVRIAALMGAFDLQQRAAFWMGAVVADDVAHLARHTCLAGGAPVCVGGREPQRSLYTTALRARLAQTVVALEGDLAEAASALGARAVADRYQALVAKPG